MQDLCGAYRPRLRLGRSRLGRICGSASRYELVLTSDNPSLSVPTRCGEVFGPDALTEASAELSSSVRDYLRAASAENTRRAYRADMRHFVDWGGRVPASDVVVAEYLAAHAGKLAVATLERRLAAISKAHTTQGLPSPTHNELVRMTMRGIKRTHGRPQRQAAPATTEIMLAMVEGLGDGIDVRDRVLILIGFAGAFRRSELCEVDFTDLEFVDRGLLITIRRSKTDQERRGRAVAIPRGRGSACPVEALRCWLARAQIDAGPVFRSVSRHGRVSVRRLCPEAVGLVVKARANAIGLDERRYSGHSLRAGLATSAAAAGVRFD